MIEKQPPLEAICAALADLHVEYHSDDGGDWVSVPIRHNEAIEIEPKPADHFSGPDGDSFAIYTRTWDHTHALDTEIFLAVVTHGLVPCFVRGVIAEYEASERAADPGDFTYTPGDRNVNYLEAPYGLLVRAFGNDGTVAPRDEYKSMCTWDVETAHGQVEVYDYKIGKCYASDGLERTEITYWHVQGEPEAIREMLAMLERAQAEGGEAKAPSQAVQRLWKLLVAADSGDGVPALTPEPETEGGATVHLGQRGVTKVYKRALFDAFCAVTGEDPETVAERLEDVRQARHDEMADSMERFETDGGARFYDNTLEG